MSTPATATATMVKLSAPGLLPRNANRLAYVFGSCLREAAEPLRVAFLEQLPAGSSLRHASRLEARARIAFVDRRRRGAHNLEPVLSCALEAALRDAGWGAHDVELQLQLRGGAARPGTTVELRGWETSRS
jgi:hypothetical protein